MYDIPHIIESPEMKAVVAAIEELKRVHSKPDTSTGCITFTQLSSGRFQAREVLEILAREDNGDQGQMDVLATAFSAWLLFPKHKEIRFNWMLHSVLDHMDMAERRAGLGDEGWTVERDIIARYFITGDKFLRDMYDSAGGYQAFMRISAHDVLDQVFEYDIRAVRTVAYAMRYMHVGAHELESDTGNGTARIYKGYRCRQLSVNRAADVFEGLRRGRRKKENKKASLYEHVARSMLHKRWKDNKGTLALIYAASCISATSRKSLLDILLEGRFSYTSHRPILVRWLGMARHAADYIFSKMKDPQLMRSTDKLISGVKPIAFPAPALADEESAQFVDGFLYKNNLL
ncbi:MAG: hypothetical protein WBA36_14970 [Mesorhizobium sp.]